MALLGAFVIFHDSGFVAIVTGGEVVSWRLTRAIIGPGNYIAHALAVNGGIQSPSFMYHQILSKVEDLEQQLDFDYHGSLAPRNMRMVYHMG
jgi:hypothetical protein